MVRTFCFESGDVPKWLKGPHSKCGRPGNRCEGSNPSISAFLSGCDRRKFYLYFMYKKHFHLLTIVCFICIISTVMKTQPNIGDWSNGMIGVSKTFGGSSILSSPAINKCRRFLYFRGFRHFLFLSFIAGNQTGNQKSNHPNCNIIIQVITFQSFNALPLSAL